MIFDSIDRLDSYASLSSDFAEAAEAVKRLLAGEDVPCGKIEVSDRISIKVMEYEPKPFEEGQFETHRQYADIQILLKGRECFFTAEEDTLCETKAYSAESDCRMLTGEPQTKVILTPGYFVIALPKDAHMPSIRDGEKITVKKAVVKVRLD